MRVDVKKYLFIGLREEKKEFFERAQKLGIIHFIKMEAGACELQKEVQLYVEAIKVLRHEVPVEQKELSDLKHAHQIAEEITKHKHALDKWSEEIRLAKLEIARIQIFGDFSLEDIQYINAHNNARGHRVIQFFCTKKGNEKAKEAEGLIYIGSEDVLDYFVAINKEPTFYEGMIEMKIDKSLGNVREALKKAEYEKKEIEHKLAHLACYKDFLHKALIDATNRMDLQNAEGSVKSELNNSVFFALGWVPVNKLNLIAELTDQTSVQVEEVAIEPEDPVPTYLENKNLARTGQDVINIYDTPNKDDKDPSLWVLFAFLIFFSIIIGDGGYGSVFLGLALYLRYKFPHLKAVKKRVLNLFTMICVGCIVWGILTSNYFGISLSPENPLRKMSIVTYLVEKKVGYNKDLNNEVYQTWLKDYPTLSPTASPHEMLKQGYIVKEGEKNYELLFDLTDQVMIELALVIGIIHIILGMLRYGFRRLSQLGWVLVIIGGFLYAPIILGTPTFLNYVYLVPVEKAADIGLQLMLFGLPLAVVLAIISVGLKGIFEFMSIIQIFGDVLSYLRLYALGLSGSIVSATINNMSSKLHFLVAVFLIIIGHLINMGLGVMSGIIHGLRLNFLEWYHYSFDGGGKPFKPLEIKEID